MTRPATRSPRQRPLLLLALVAVAAGLTAEAQAPTSAAGVAEVRSLSFPTPTATRDVYRALGQAWGVFPVFAPDLEARQIAIELSGVTAEEAFARVARAAGHLHQRVAERWVLIADDTPEKRRRYQTQVIRLFTLDHASARDLAVLLRNALDLNRTAVAGDDGRLLMVRDTAARVEAAAALIDAVDRPPAEVELDVEVLLLTDRGAVAEVLGRTRDTEARTRRLGFDQLERLRGAGRRLAAPGLAAVDRGRARWRLLRELVVDAGGEVATVTGGLDLTFRPRVHAGGEVTLEIAATWTDTGRPTSGASAASVPGAPRVRLAVARAQDPDREAVRERLRQRLRSRPRPLQGGDPTPKDLAASTGAGEWRTRLAPGEALLASGILPPAAERGLIAAAILGDAVNGELVVAVTPRVIRGRELPESDFEIICASADDPIGVCGDAGHEQP